MTHPDNEPGKSYDVDDRRRTAALKACDGLPTEALERGIVNELYKAIAYLRLMDHMAERRGGYVLLLERQWLEEVRARINVLNDTVVPGSTLRKSN